jgi:hypothetical protein
MPETADEIDMLIAYDQVVSLSASLWRMPESREYAREAGIGKITGSGKSTHGFCRGA